MLNLYYPHDHVIEMEIFRLDKIMNYHIKQKQQVTHIEDRTRESRQIIWLCPDIDLYITSRSDIIMIESFKKGINIVHALTLVYFPASFSLFMNCLERYFQSSQCYKRVMLNALLLENSMIRCAFLIHCAAAF